MYLMYVLFVWTRNACRSPLAEALLKKLRSAIDVDSAGTYPYYKVVDFTKRYAEQEGAREFFKIVPDRLESKNLNNYNLIIAMETEHEQAILRQAPDCVNNVVVWHICAHSIVNNLLLVVQNNYYHPSMFNILMVNNFCF